MTNPSILPVALRPRDPLPSLRASVGTQDVTGDVFGNDIVAQRFLARADRDGLTHITSRSFPRQEPDLPALDRFGTVAWSWSTRSGEDVLVDARGGAAVLLALRHGSCEVVVAAPSAADARQLAGELEEALRDAPPPDERVPMRFWAMGPHGPEAERRAIEAPAWDEVASNYPAAVRAQVAELTAATEPVGGSLVLWHGPPGTGKTHALQALARAWRPWCTTHYVTDPEQLLRGTNYLMEVATRKLGDDGAPWRLIVLEDAGELMAADARSEIGQGLSRVLNLTDGLLGQGLRCLLLVTTNEPLGRLHPAIRRPGRCWAEVAFPAFPATEAAAWLALREVQGAPPPGRRTLAELFALAEGRITESGAEGAAEAFGFARAALCAAHHPPPTGFVTRRR